MRRNYLANWRQLRGEATACSLTFIETCDIRGSTLEPSITLIFLLYVFLSKNQILAIDYSLVST